MILEICIRLRVESASVNRPGAKPRAKPGRKRRAKPGQEKPADFTLSGRKVVWLPGDIGSMRDDGNGDGDFDASFDAEGPRLNGDRPHRPEGSW